MNYYALNYGLTELVLKPGEWGVRGSAGSSLPVVAGTVLLGSDYTAPVEVYVSPDGLSWFLAKTFEAAENTTEVWNFFFQDTGLYFKVKLTETTYQAVDFYITG